MTAMNPPPKAKMPVPIDQAAMENLTPYFLGILNKIGLEVVIVSFRAGGDSPVWKHDSIERELSQELQSIQAGQYDSSVFTPGVVFHFFHASDLGKAMQQLKSSLSGRGLLEVSTLFHAETARELRVWHPATAELLNIGTESEP